MKHKWKQLDLSTAVDGQYCSVCCTVKNKKNAGAECKGAAKLRPFWRVKESANAPDLSRLCPHCKQDTKKFGPCPCVEGR